MTANLNDRKTNQLLQRAQRAVENIDRTLSCPSAQSQTSAMSQPVESDFVASLEEAKSQLHRGW